MMRAHLSLIAVFLGSISLLSFGACKRTESPTPAPSTSTQPVTHIPGPMPGTRMTEAYVSQVGRSVYYWAWPMVNIHNRMVAFSNVSEPGYMGGIVPAAPLNTLAMLHDYIAPEERVVACPNQDVVYGLGVLDFSKEPVVVQVPDFGDRFWVYQVVDQRTDSFAQLGKMYGTKPGFYLLTGPNWKGTVPNGINGVFHASTTLAVVVPRVFRDDTPEDLAAVQTVINKIMMYPLSKFTGQTQTKDWTALPAPSPHRPRARKKPNGSSRICSLTN